MLLCMLFVFWGIFFELFFLFYFLSSTHQPSMTVPSVPKCWGSYCGGCGAWQSLPTHTTFGFYVLVCLTCILTLWPSAGLHTISFEEISPAKKTHIDNKHHVKQNFDMNSVCLFFFLYIMLKEVNWFKKNTDQCIQVSHIRFSTEDEDEWWLAL